MLEKTRLQYFHNRHENDLKLRKKCLKIKRLLLSLELRHSNYGFPKRLNSAVISYKKSALVVFDSKFEKNVRFIKNLNTQEYVPVSPVEYFLCSVLFGNIPSFEEFPKYGITEWDILTYFLENMREITGSAAVYDLLCK